MWFGIPGFIFLSLHKSNCSKYSLCVNELVIYNMNITNVVMDPSPLDLWLNFEWKEGLLVKNSTGGFLST